MEEKIKNIFFVERILKIIENIKNWEIKNEDIIFILWIIFISLIVVSTVYYVFGENAVMFFQIFIAIFIVFVIYFYSTKNNKPKKQEVVSKLKQEIKQTDDKIEYDIKDKFPISFKEFWEKSKFMRIYDKIEKQEDYIKIEDKDYQLYWMEIKTWKLDYSDNWKKYVLANHSYILLIDILNHRFPIKSDVILKPDVNTHIIHKILYWLEDINNVLDVLYILVKNFSISLVFKIIILIAITSVISYIISWNLLNSFTILSIILWILILIGIEITSKNRVILENEKFEKIFDVYSKNEIEVRRLLTPKMMEKLVELVNKSWKSWWSFNFSWNKIYAKFDVDDNFLEVKGIDDKAWMSIFLEEIELIKDLVNYINLEYFSEDMFIKNNLEK